MRFLSAFAIVARVAHWLEILQVIECTTTSNGRYVVNNTGRSYPTRIVTR